MIDKLSLWVVAGCLLNLSSAIGHAEDQVTPAPTEDTTPLSPLAAFDSENSLSASELTEQRAMAKIEIERVTINDTDQDGTVTDNSAVNNTTGHNSIAGDAFSRADGFISTVQNTGNNVLIQNSTTINVSVER